MNKYDQIMDHVSLSEETRNRILAKTEKTAARYEEGPGTIKRRRFSRYLAIAACFVLLLAGAGAALNKGLPSDRDIASGRQKEAEAVNSDADAYAGSAAEDSVKDASGEAVLSFDTAEELSSFLGYRAAGPEGLEKASSRTVYQAVGQDKALISYHTDRGDFRYEISPDLSEEVSDYPDIKKIRAGKRTVTLAGEDGNYSLALWKDQDFSYRIRAGNGQTEQWWEKLIQ